MKFAFIAMGDEYNALVDNHCFKHNTNETFMVCVQNMDQAYKAVDALVRYGIDLIELCGAFGEDGTNKIIEHTNNKIPIGYVIHNENQDDKFEKLFNKK